MTTEAWVRAQRYFQGKLSAEEEQLLAMLVAGKTQPEIAAILGLHRSAVWRRIQKLKRKFSVGDGAAREE